MNPSRLLLSTALLALAACTTTPPAPAPVAAAPSAAPWFGEYATTYRCSDTQTATVAFAGDTMQLRVGDDVRDLQPVQSASGARYQAVGEPSTVFWSKGDGALVTWRGDDWPECKAVTRGVQALRADGKNWQLEMYGPRVSLRDADGQPLAEGRTMGPRRIGNTVTVNALTARGMVVVTALEKVCPGPQPRPLTVQVAWDGRILDGCGGETSALLQSAVWVVEDIAGAGIIDNSRVTMNFAPGGHVAGRASCNQYTGTYTLGPDTATFSRTAATMMMCPQALMLQEERFLKALQATRRIEFTPEGFLVLVAADGTRTRAHRE